MGFFLSWFLMTFPACVSNRFDLALKVSEIEEVKDGKRDQKFYFQNDLLAVFYNTGIMW